MENEMVIVTNRNNGYTGYRIPDTGVSRNFAPRESKRISKEELMQLSYIEGGEYLLKNYLIVNNDKTLEELNISVQPEYYYTEEEIKELLTTGSLDQLEDTLNFAPDGVIEIIKDMAVKTELPDTRKRKMISEKTGFNIDNAIRVNEVMAEDQIKDEHSEPIERKASPINVESDTPQRKAAPIKKYKVVTKS